MFRVRIVLGLWLCLGLNTKFGFCFNPNILECPAQSRTRHRSKFDTRDSDWLKFHLTSHPAHNKILSVQHQARQWPVQHQKPVHCLFFLKLQMLPDPSQSFPRAPLCAPSCRCCWGLFCRHSLNRIHPGEVISWMEMKLLYTGWIREPVAKLFPSFLIFFGP